MSVNKYMCHLYILPEDDADRQIANGFVLHDNVDARRVQVISEAGGWARVLDIFEKEYQHILKSSRLAHLVMLVDFDNKLDQRRGDFSSRISPDIKDRVFVVGPLDEPETLKPTLDGIGFEAIGTSLAEDCYNEKWETWDSPHLSHNKKERVRLAETVRPFLFKCSN